ncbi:MAG: SDR family NAD(P)-dependent oxidoreductase [Planctomycetota bacterium]|nr:SDR family NAD(P)-dependent oxidoreductase [Planctomycetota bacterium]
MTRLLVSGATAAMVRSTLEAFAAEGASIALAARDAERAERLAEALRAGGAQATCVLPFDAADPAAADGLVGAAIRELGGLDAVLVAHGALTDQTRFESDPEARRRSLQVNGLSAVALRERAAAHFEERGHGCVAAISSGAGARGRRATYGYGLGKGLVTLCMQGLRARLHRSGVSALTIVPCFVDTPMTARLPARLRFVSADDAGRRIHRAMVRGDDLLHVPRWWRLALLLARNAPEWMVKRSRTEERFAAQLPGSEE